jgi:hypothetical protein
MKVILSGFIFEDAFKTDNFIELFFSYHDEYFLPSCKSVGKPRGRVDSTKLSSNNFLRQIMQLDQFKQEQKRVDSLKELSPGSTAFHVDIIDSSFLSKDKGKNISLGLIIEDQRYNQKETIYTIRFDKTQQKIISIDK